MKTNLDSAARSVAATEQNATHDYTIAGWTYGNRAGSAGSKEVRRWVGRGLSAVSVSLTGFRARLVAVQEASGVEHEHADTRAYIRDQHYDGETGWLSFTAVVVQRGRTLAASAGCYWQLAYAVSALEPA
ncbi:MAG: hypothetical protein AAGH19_10605 [Pseudomonadota bacterium]